MEGKDIVKQIIDMLIRANKIPANFTGEVSLSAILEQGGLRNAKLGTIEPIR